MDAKPTIIDIDLPAGFISRLEAFIADLIILTVAIFGANWGFDLVYRFFVQMFFRSAPTPSGQYAPYISLFITLGYFIYFWDIIGATPGKLIFGLKICRLDGGDITFARSVVRLIGYWISAIPFFLGFLWIIFDKRRQSWHDKLADTHVIYIRTKGSKIYKK
jgi:uncharacterized RDD family membrane protein YckC